ncbi:MAG TPA: enoyl-CoA hydratase/isomerase family protein [Anaerolineae bacterium]|nr:enoyl-CoA hydratase/isomerase family protein [Anaerolineae bacterium]
MSDLILTAHKESVWEITLNRPDKRNAINLDMMTAFDDAITAAMRAEGVRVIVIKGLPGLFSAGIDVTAFLTMPDKYGPQWQRFMRRVTDDFQGVLTRLERIELPTIAVIEGYCLGLALELVMACDMRLVLADTKVGLPETRLGIIPDVGGTTRLTRIVGVGRAKEMIMTGAHYTAESVADWGLFNYVVADQAALQAKTDWLVNELNQAAPLAIGMAKRVIDGLGDIDRGLQLEGWAQSQLFRSEDFGEAVQSFMTKQKPNFKGK